MALFRITVKNLRYANGIKVEKGMSVEVMEIRLLLMEDIKL